MKEIMDSYHRERVDADRHLKERNRIAKRYFDLEKKVHFPLACPRLL